jgi:hypothetical protein
MSLVLPYTPLNKCVVCSLVDETLSNCSVLLIALDQPTHLHLWQFDLVKCFSLRELYA